jgi:hypothetical protein
VRWPSGRPAYRVGVSLLRIILSLGLVLVLGLACCFSGLLIVAPGTARAIVLEKPWSDARILESQRRGDELVDALVRYRKTNGGYPTTLDILVPQYLPKIRPPTAGKGRWEYSGGEGTFDLSFATARQGGVRCYYMGAKWNMSGPS